MTDISQFFGFIWAGVIIVPSYAFAKLYLGHRVKDKQTEARILRDGGGNAVNPLGAYDSFWQVAKQAEDLLEQQYTQIKVNCEKEGKDVMKDTGANTVLAQYQAALKWRTRFESPLGKIVDSVSFPIARAYSTEAVKIGMKYLKSLSGGLS